MQFIKKMFFDYLSIKIYFSWFFANLFLSKLSYFIAHFFLVLMDSFLSRTLCIFLIIDAFSIQFLHLLFLLSYMIETKILRSNYYQQYFRFILQSSSAFLYFLCNPDCNLFSSLYFSFLMFFYIFFNKQVLLFQDFYSFPSRHDFSNTESFNGYLEKKNRKQNR